MRHWLKANLTRSVVIVIVFAVVGAALRILGLTWGLPTRLNADEWVIVTGALDMAQRNSFEPSLYMRPDHVEIQLSFIAYQAFSHLVLHVPVEVGYTAHPGMYLFISRAVTALFGCAMIVLAYLIGRQFHPAVGVIAAGLFALFPAFVYHSHFATPDIPMTAAFMAVILACMAYVSKPRLASLLVASGATSVAIAIKYPGAIAAVTIAIVVVFAAVRDRALHRIVTHGMTAIVAVVGFLFLISPVLFTNFTAVMAAIKQESRTEHPGADGLGFGGNLAFYADNFWAAGGVLLTLAALIGTFAVIRLRLTAALPLLLGVVYWISMAVLPLHWERWTVPMLITPVMLAGVGMFSAYRYLGSKDRWRRWRKPVFAVGGAIVGLNLLVSSAAITAVFMAPDTRLSSDAVLADAGITADNTAYEGYSPFAPGDPHYVFDAVTISDGTIRPIDPTKRFVMTSDCQNQRFFDDAKYGGERDFYASLSSDLTEVVRIRPTVSAGRASALEPVNIWRSVEVIGEVLRGGKAGCDVRVFQLDG